MSQKFQNVDISPEQFELQVKEWLQNAGSTLNNFSINHLEMLKGDSGDYEIDAVAEFTIFGQASIKVLVECKKYKSPVKRDVIIVLEGKIRDSNAHKGMVFSTAGFQSGAIEYASKRGIATLSVQHGHTNYFTKSLDSQPAQPPSWLKISEYIGWFIKQIDLNSQSCSLVDTVKNEQLFNWIHNKE